MRDPMSRPLAGLTGYATTVLAAACLVACVEPFSGSKMELLFRSTILLPGDDGRYGRPPSDTHFELYGVKDDSAFLLRSFDIKPVLLRADRCFIEEGDARFPGLHSTQIEIKVREAALADGQVTDLEAGDIALAQRRVSLQPALESQVRVVVAHDDALTAAVVGTFQATVPDPLATDDASNAQRLERCLAFFAEHPAYYVGTDKRLAIPINGIFFGVVEGRDPRNNGNLGGAAFDVDFNLEGIDALRINWQFNDPADPRIATYGASPLGYHYMAGRPTQRLREVINVPMRHNDVAQIAGEIAIFVNVGDDEVNF